MSRSKDKVSSHSMQSYYGHKSRCFDVSFLKDEKGVISSDNSMFLSASEDGNAKLWDVSKKKVLHSFSHSRSFEVLRASFVVQDYVIATCASDGSVIVWIKQVNGKYHRKHILNHGGGQVYACEVRSSAYSIVKPAGASTSTSNRATSNGSSTTSNGTTTDDSTHVIKFVAKILTVADDKLFLWEVTNEDIVRKSVIHTVEHVLGAEVERERPDDEDLVYIFDCKISKCDADGFALVSLGLSDGTVSILTLHLAEVKLVKENGVSETKQQGSADVGVSGKTDTSGDETVVKEIHRIIVDDNIKMQCVSSNFSADDEEGGESREGEGGEGGSASRNQRFAQVQVTATSWSDDRLAFVICLGDGNVLLFKVGQWTFRQDGITLEPQAFLRSHTKACYGAIFLCEGLYKDLLCTWSSDGNVVIWSTSTLQGLVDAPAYLVDMKQYPVYSCVLVDRKDTSAEGEVAPPIELLCAGGGQANDNAFMGNPMHLVCINIATTIGSVTGTTGTV